MRYTRRLNEGVGDTVKKWVTDFMSGGSKADAAKKNAEKDGVDIESFVEKIKADEDKEDASAQDISDFMDKMHVKDYEKRIIDYRKHGLNPKIGQMAPERVATPPKKGGSMYKLPESVEEVDALLEAISRKDLTPEEVEELEAYESGYTSIEDLSPVLKRRAQGEIDKNLASPARSDQYEDATDRKIRRALEKSKEAKAKPKPSKSVIVNKSGVETVNGFHKPKERGTFVGQVSGTWMPRVWLGQKRRIIDPATNKPIWIKVKIPVTWHAWEWDGQQWLPNPWDEDKYAAEHMRESVETDETLVLERVRQSVRTALKKHEKLVREATRAEEEAAGVKMYSLERGPKHLSLLSLYEDPTYDEVTSVAKVVPEVNEDEE